MTPRTSALIGALALAASLLTATGTAAADGVDGTRTGVGLPRIVEAAKAKAAQKFPDARFFGAEADLDHPPVQGVGSIRRWALNFTEASRPTGGFSYIYGVDGEYEQTVIWEPRVGIEVVDPFTMIEDKALAALRGSGVTEPFSELYLAQPVVPDTEPIYYFCVVSGGEGRVFGVGTRTLEVYPDLFACVAP